MKLEAGKKVRIRTFKTRPNHWNSYGSMDYLMGNLVEISSVDGDGIKVIGEIWSFKENDFEEINSNEPTLNVIL